MDAAVRHAVFMLQNAANPQIRRRLKIAQADFLADQIGGFGNILAGIEEHDIREVALLLRLPEGTVKSRLFLARQRLKELLQ